LIRGERGNERGILLMRMRVRRKRKGSRRNRHRVRAKTTFGRIKE